MIKTIKICNDEEAFDEEVSRVIDEIKKSKRFYKVECSSVVSYGDIYFIAFIYYDEDDLKKLRGV